MHSNYFQMVWASQHPQSISHLPLVSQVIVAKEKSKPNISNFSGPTSPSAARENEGEESGPQDRVFSAPRSFPLSKGPKSSQFPLEQKSFLAPVKWCSQAAPRKPGHKFTEDTAYSLLLGMT